MNEKVEILTKVYGLVNRIKVCLTFNDILGAWKVLNEISEYLVSVDCAPTPRALDVCSQCGSQELIEYPEDPRFFVCADCGKRQ